MLLIPAAGFGKIIESHGSTRPAAAFGTSLTALQSPSVGSWTQVIAGASVTDRVHGILINLNSIALSATNKECLVDIGIDEAGGSSYTQLIPSLGGACAYPYNVGTGGVWYYFPLNIKAGSSIAARASVNWAVPGTARVSVQLFCAPSMPVWAGSYVRAYGADLTACAGVAVTSGTTSEGAWTQIGTIAAGDVIRWFQATMSVNDSTMTALCYHLDVAVGDATNKKIVISNQIVSSTAAEQMGNFPSISVGHGVAGENIYARLQCSGTADANTKVLVHGVG